MSHEPHAVLTDALRETAALYALGALPEDESRTFERHLAAGCPVCEAEAESNASVTSDLALAALPVPPPATLRDKVLSAARATAHPFQYVLADEGEWIEIVPGVARKELGAATETSRSYLLRAAPGARIPMHPHTAIEHCVVLSGDLHSGGRALGPGDYSRAAAGSIHDEIWSVSGCTFLIIEAAS